MSKANAYIISEAKHRNTTAIRSITYCPSSDSWKVVCRDGTQHLSCDSTMQIVIKGKIVFDNTKGAK